MQESKICSSCKVEKNLTEFFKQKGRKFGVSSNCKACKKEHYDSLPKKEPSVTHKICTKCNTEYPVSFFSKAQKKKDGLSYTCKLCDSKYISKYYIENIDKIKSNSIAYRSIEKNAEAARLRAAKWKKDNPERSKEYQIIYRKNNAEKIRAYKRHIIETYPERNKSRCSRYYYANREKIIAYNNAHKDWYKIRAADYRRRKPEVHRANNSNRRARIMGNGGKLSKCLADKLFKLQKGKCACCKKSVKTGYHLDHIYPLKLGGAHEDSNIQILCPTCNHQKAAKHPVDFMQSKGYLF